MANLSAPCFMRVATTVKELRRSLFLSRAEFREAPIKRLWLRHFDEYPTTPCRDARVSRRQTDQEFTI